MMIVAMMMVISRGGFGRSAVGDGVNYARDDDDDDDGVNDDDDDEKIPMYVKFIHGGLMITMP